MRGARAFVVLTVYLTLMSGFTALLYMISSSTKDIYGFTSGGTIGRYLFFGIVGIELFLVTFIAPAFTAGAISGERERQTYDLLKTTLLPARALIVGKMTSALSYVFLLLLAAIPLQSIAFLFGGVTEAERPAQLDAGAFERGFRCDDFLDGADGHTQLPTANSPKTKGGSGTRLLR